MKALPGGSFEMGSDAFYADEKPVRRVTVDPFAIAEHPVTNNEFAAFVDGTGYVTEAEKPPDPWMYPGANTTDLVPGALVFTMTPGPVDLNDYTKWWRWVPGASWRHPLGPESSIDDLGDHPVVQVSYADAAAYCAWTGSTLPTEEEWEFAARGGLAGADFTWGDHDPQETEPVANTWQGRFPFENTEIDGHARTSPVGSYPPNGFGLFDMAGNVWEWTVSWYVSVRQQTACCAPHAPRREDSYDPSSDVKIPRKVVKGGSHLCTPQYCYRYRPAARQPQTIETATSHLGFRAVVRAPSNGGGSW